MSKERKLIFLIIEIKRNEKGHQKLNSRSLSFRIDYKDFVTITNIHSYCVKALLIFANARAFGGDSRHCANRLTLKRQMFPIKILDGR